MTESVHAVPAQGRGTWDGRLAGLMFFLSLLFLVVLAGLFHRYPRPECTDAEVQLILGSLGALWLVFLVESTVRFLLRDRQGPVWQPLFWAVACSLLPPLRMGCRGLSRPNDIWLPGLGWQPVDAHLRRILERFFSVPMFFCALMVLPLLALEYYWAEQIRAEPVLALWLDVGTSVIWLAFSIELILMVAVADRPVHYCFIHWIDLAIVLLPAIEALPLFRLLRLGRILRLEQLLRYGRLYRLQALALRGWRALLLLDVIQRLTGRSLQHRLEHLRELLRAKEEELADLHKEIAEVTQRISREAPSDVARAG
jgi:hypothetical protein